LIWAWFVTHLTLAVKGRLGAGGWGLGNGNGNGNGNGIGIGLDRMGEGMRVGAEGKG
jgi:hypothetical protein